MLIDKVSLREQTILFAASSLRMKLAIWRHEQIVRGDLHASIKQHGIRFASGILRSEDACIQARFIDASTMLSASQAKQRLRF
jgi:hypothetical protein